MFSFVSCLTAPRGKERLFLNSCSVGFQLSSEYFSIGGSSVFLPKPLPSVSLQSVFLCFKYVAHSVYSDDLTSKKQKQAVCVYNLVLLHYKKVCRDDLTEQEATLGCFLLTGIVLSSWMFLCFIKKCPCFVFSRLFHNKGLSRSHLTLI